MDFVPAGRRERMKGTNGASTPKRKYYPHSAELEERLRARREELKKKNALRKIARKNTVRTSLLGK